MKRMIPIIGVLGLILSFFAQVAHADWTAAKRLTWTEGKSRFPAVATGSGNAVHVVWADETPGNQEVYYRRSTDGGTTWKAAQRLTWNSGESSAPVVAADSGNTIHVVWDDDTPGDEKIYYRRSTNGGANWDPVKRLSWTADYSLEPAVAIDSEDRIHLVWRDGMSGSSQVYYRMSEDGGDSWSGPKRISWTSGWSFIPDIAIDPADAIHVVWYSYVSGKGEIYYRRSTDGGITWDPAKRLTWNSGNSIYPAICADGGSSIHVVWYDDTPGNEEVYYKGSGDGGGSWGTVKRLTWHEQSQRSPSVAANSSGDVYVVWQDSRIALGELYYRSSADQGATWTAARRLTWTERYSNAPAAAASGNTIHIVWCDDTPGNYEIYYKSGN